MNNVGNVGCYEFTWSFGNAPTCILNTLDIPTLYPNWPCEYSGVYYTDTPNNQGTNSCQLLSNMSSPSSYPGLCNCCDNTPNNLIFDASDALDGNTNTYTASCAQWGCTAP